MSAAKIPETDSIQELAHFWDTHDLTEFEDQIEETPERVFVREDTVDLRLSPDESRSLRRFAEARGVPYQVLVRELAPERIHAA
ncbi:MAG: CopG family antitoxin [Candidatus Sumerlaeota bacterium]|nr:CopG family antitoxin [Candidatus Sumerlaeota bacterium]